jgi:hypothetical protein
MRKGTHRLNPVGFSVGKVADVTIFSQKLRTSGAIAGREGSNRSSGKSDIGIGGVDRSHRREGQEDEQVVRLMMAFVRLRLPL